MAASHPHQPTEETYCGVESSAEGYRAAMRYVPTCGGLEIGGDFCDVLAIDSGHLGVLIGDVSGKGLDAASQAATARGTLRALVQETGSPAAALTHACAALHAQQPDSGSFVTVFLAVIDVNSGSFIYANGGHPFPIILRATGDLEELGYGQPPVALVSDTVYVQQESRMAPGDTMVAYTDGIIEARRDHAMFGQEGIQRILMASRDCSPDDIADKILWAAREWVGGPTDDDIALVVLKRENTPQEGSS